MHESGSGKLFNHRVLYRVHMISHLRNLANGSILELIRHGG